MNTLKPDCIHVEGLGGGKEGMGKLATVWGGEIVGMRGGMQMAPEDRTLLVLSDFQPCERQGKPAGPELESSRKW